MTKLLALFCTCLLFLSCKREFEDNSDFNNNEIPEVFGDNTLLFNKIFQFSGSSGAYLWFDIRNEIANFSSPFLGHPYKIDEVDRYKRVDYRGRLYSYNAADQELTIRDYPLDIATGEDLPADIVYSFARKQKEGCALIQDATQRNTCERTFVLRLKRLFFKTIDLTLTADQKANYGNRTIEIEGISQELILTN